MRGRNTSNIYVNWTCRRRRWRMHPPGKLTQTGPSNYTRFPDIYFPLHSTPLRIVPNGMKKSPPADDFAFGQKCIFSKFTFLSPFLSHPLSRGVPISFLSSSTSSATRQPLFTSPVVNLELPQSSTAATHYVRVARSIHASPRIVQDAPVILRTTLDSRRNLLNVSLVTLHASMHMENSVSPFLSPPRLTRRNSQTSL